MKFSRARRRAGGVNQRKLLGQPCTWPPAHPTSLPATPFELMAVTLFDNKGYAAIIVVKSPSREFAVSLSPIETAVQKLVDDEQLLPNLVKEGLPTIHELAWLAHTSGAFVDTDLQCHILDQKAKDSQSAVTLVALPEQVGDHERAASFQSRNSHSGAVLETGDRVGARGLGEPP